MLSLIFFLLCIIVPHETLATSPLDFYLPEIDVVSFAKSNFTNYDWVISYAKERGIFLGAMILTSFVTSLFLCCASCCAKFCRCCCDGSRCALFQNNRQKYFLLAILSGGLAITALSSQVYSTQMNSAIEQSLEPDILGVFTKFNNQAIKLSDSVNSISANVFDSKLAELGELNNNVSSILQTVSLITTQVHELSQEFANTSPSFDKQDLTNIDQDMSTNSQFLEANRSFATVRENINKLRNNIVGDGLNFNQSSVLQDFITHNNDIQSSIQDVFDSPVNLAEDGRNNAHQVLLSLGYVVCLLIVANLYLLWRNRIQDQKPNSKLRCCSLFWLQLLFWFTSFLFSFYFVVQDGTTMVCQLSRFVRGNVGVLVPNQQTQKLTAAIDSCFNQDPTTWVRNPLNISLHDYVNVGAPTEYNTNLHLTNLVQEWDEQLGGFTARLVSTNTSTLFGFSSTSVDQALQELNDASATYEHPPVVYTRSNIDDGDNNSTGPTTPQHQETIQALMAARNLTDMESEYQTKLVDMRQLSQQIVTELGSLKNLTAATESRLNHLFDPQEIVDRLQNVLDTTSCSFLGQQYMAVENDVCDKLLSSISGIVTSLFVALVFQNALFYCFGCRAKD